MREDTKMLLERPIRTSDKVIRARGKVFYNDRRRRLDLKRPIRDLIPEGSVSYVMELCLSDEKALARLKELVEKGVMPVLLYFDGGDTE
jgi:hypothetical protein